MAYKKIILAILFSIDLASAVVAQPFPTQNLPLINGFTKAHQGEVLPYFSVYRKYAKDALLTRCTDGKKAIEWETDIIPENTAGEYAYFTWIAAHSSGTSSGDRHFDLYINDEPALTFTTHAQQYPAYWAYTGKDGTALQFEFKIRDGANDSHGMAYLKVPLKKYPKGRSLKLKVVGQNQQSNDWYMTFAYSFKEKAEITALPFLLKGQKQQVLNVTVLHFGRTDTLHLVIDQSIYKKYPVNNGFNSFQVAVPATHETRKLLVRTTIGSSFSQTDTVHIRPVTYRELNLIHHSHTDIGYSHVQEEVIRIHNHNIREALRLIEKTKQYPQESRFIWHIESAWVVENFFQEATEEEKAQFIQAAKSNQIVVSANYANIMTGLCMPEEIDWISDYAIQLRDKYQIPIHTAMLTDVPGMSWSVVASLAKRDIRYFSNGINYIESMPGGGDRIGHALTKHGDRPFWWKSPTGKDSILMWCAGKGYSAWHGTAQGAVFELGPEKIAGYLNQLDAQQYPYPLVQWRYNIVADNGPTDSTICDFVKQWNEQYASPKLVLANVQDLFARFEKAYGHSIPAYSGDFTPYWEDGAYSTAQEEADNRLAAQKIISLEHVIQQKRLAIDPPLLPLAKKYVLLFHEHTWGAHNSITEPDIAFVKHQWAYKKSYLDSALLYTQQLATAVADQLKQAGAIRVINTSGYPRSGYVELDAAYKGMGISDAKGRNILLQQLPDGRTAFIATDVPAKGEKLYRLTKQPSIYRGKLAHPIGFEMDKATGALNNIKTGHKNWLDTNAALKGLAQALYINGLDPSKYETARLLRAVCTVDGPIVNTWRFSYAMNGVDSVVYEISRYKGLDFLKVAIAFSKIAIRSKESIHFALPFAIKNANTRFGAGDGVVEPEHLQLAGANRDFYAVQRWLNVGNDRYNVTVCSPQGALYEIGDIVNEEKVINGYKKWKETTASSSLVFLYALNNYWHTNFKADQSGMISFDIYLQFGQGPFDAKTAERFGYACTQPLTVVLPK